MLCRGCASHVIRGLNLQGATFEAKKGTPDSCGAKNRAQNSTVFSVDISSYKSLKYSGATTSQVHLRLIGTVYF